ncbi:hypothetical protein Tco_1374928 [Tanacetum coccineum]
MENVDLCNINLCWGNSSFDYICGPSVVYAPYELSKKKGLWDYLHHTTDNWVGEVVIMGTLMRFTLKMNSNFNTNGATIFNLISDGLMQSCPNISALTVDLGFDMFVKNAWNDSYSEDPNAMINFINKMKNLKKKLCSWISSKKESLMNQKSKLNSTLVDIDKIIDTGNATSDLLNNCINVMNSLHDLEKLNSLEVAQKTKTKWSIEGDENSKYFHGILNKRRNNLAIRGISVDGVWIDSPSTVKNEFLSHFANRFDCPSSTRVLLDMNFPNHISLDTKADLERKKSLKKN